MVWLKIDGGLKDVIFIPEYHGNINFVISAIFSVFFVINVLKK